MQTVMSSAETAAMLFWALPTFGMFTMRKADGCQRLVGKPSDRIIDLALKRQYRHAADCAKLKSNINRGATEIACDMIEKNVELLLRHFHRVADDLLLA